MYRNYVIIYYILTIGDIIMLKMKFFNNSLQNTQALSQREEVGIQDSLHRN